MILESKLGEWDFRFDSETLCFLLHEAYFVLKKFKSKVWLYKYIKVYM